VQRERPPRRTAARDNAATVPLTADAPQPAVVDVSGRPFDARAIRRILGAYGDSADDGDIGALTELAALKRDVDHLIEVRVKAMIQLGYSWREIGDALGFGKSWTAERFGHLGAARRPGGQPADKR
jgi:lysozyme family protein